MGGVRISRRRFVTAGAVGALGALLAPETVFADDDQPEHIRWDLVAVGGNHVVPGGADVGRDAATNDTITLTGSGFANVDEGKASGGGTFVHKSASRTLSGVYYVTEFKSFNNPGGTLAGTGLTDTIGRIDRTTGGDLYVRVHAVATDGFGLSANGTLGGPLQAARWGRRGRAFSDDGLAVFPFRPEVGRHTLPRSQALN